MGITIAIVVVLVLAVVAMLVLARTRANTGKLSRETRKRDEAATPSVAATPAGTETVEESQGEARERADDARRAIESGASAVPAERPDTTPVVHQPEPIDLDELGITRRKFFNRSILAGTGLGLGAFGAASLAFLWPSGGGGFGGKVVVGSVADVETAIANKEPFYNAGAKTYVVAYPKEDVKKAEKVPSYAPVLPGMEAGFVALYQKCVHLGCRVPWCASSQWFECPCHGSKYNRVGEKQAGPAPRGLDRFALTVAGGDIVVDTGTIVIGPPIGTNTTGQSPEGAPCV